VRDPKRVGRRVEALTRGPAALQLQARKVVDLPVFASAPQQSDYVVAWDRSAGGTGGCGPAPVHRNTRKLALRTLNRLMRITKRIAPAFVSHFYRLARDRMAALHRRVRGWRAAKQFDSDLFSVIK
jgi:hypothetical protein